MVVMAPGDEQDVQPMLDFALGHDAPVAIRYPKADVQSIERDAQPIELGQAEVLDWETDGMLIACGTLVGSCLRVAERLRADHGLQRGRDERPVPQAAGSRHDPQGDRGMRLRHHRRGRLPCKAGSARPCWKPPTRRV